jgi:hypothetical protein
MDASDASARGIQVSRALGGGSREPGKPKRATGVGVWKRTPGATDSRMEQGLEVERGRPGNGKGEQNGGDVGKAVREGKALEGVRQWEGGFSRETIETWRTS